jgi:cytochrome c oxidase cbb3-type subunit 3
MSSDKGKLLNHEYDGIQELDNSLPQWWLGTFYITIIFSIFYYGYYELGSGESIDAEYKRTAAELDQKTKYAPNNNVFPDDEKLKAVIANKSNLAGGKSVYDSKCASCHAPQGQGLIGPNLVDKFWIHGKGSDAEIAKVIHDGVLDKGMPAWNALLKEEEIYQVAAYIKSLKGTNPPNAKAPQGQEYNN